MKKLHQNEDLQVSNNKKRQPTKIEDVIDDIKGDLLNTFHKIKRNSDNKNWEQLLLERNYSNLSNNADMSKNNNQNNNQKKRKHTVNEEDTVELDAKED